MTTGSSTSNIYSLLDLVRTNIVSCRHCNHTYKDPRILPCLHTFCRTCILELVTTNAGGKTANTKTTKKGSPASTTTTPNTLCCPVCKEVIQRSREDVKKLDTNPFLEHLLEICHCQDDQPKQCEYCKFDKKEAAATARCLECQDDMCDHCTEAHKRTKLTRNHKVAPFKEMQLGKYDEDIRSNQQIQCPQHKKEPITLFCTQCQQLVCRECKVHAHDSHTWSSLQEAGQQYGARIQTLLDTIKNKIPGIEEYLNYMETYTSELDKKRTKTNETIEEQAETLKAMIDDHKNGLLKEVNDACDSELEHVRSKREAITATLHSLQSHDQDLQKLVQFGKGEEILHLQKQVTKRLTELIYLEIDGLKSSLSIEFKGGNATKENVEILFGKAELCGLSMGKTNIGSLSNIKVPMSSVLPNISGSPELQLEFECKGVYDHKEIWPSGIAVNQKGDMLVVDRDNKRIKVYNSQGKYLNDFGGMGKNILWCPYDIAIMKNGNLAVTDNEKEDVKIFSPQGDAVTIIHSHFKHPRGIAVNSKGQLIVVDCGMRRLTIHDPDTGHIVQTIPAKQEDSHNYFTDPYYVTVTSNDSIIVTDWAAPNIKVFNSEGKLIGEHGTYGIQEDQILEPYGVCTDAFGYIFVADNLNHRVHLLLPDGRFKKFILTKLDKLWHPMALGINHRGELVVTEALGKVKVFKYL
ncbi:tripartite motif-containing protein 3 [Lingula anatina]|uniref:Tripartite motif-containing protein 3 n=1 Tax=Lingula anatina TaxID=7574 RepID=A0A1S3IUY0_LINAN|nr:tripartite motif-containing protein 3 [Lingula anatina]|eukprot:XP_013402010.1 tripartite motif-containing protein 3 [Lingula anatina]